MRSSHHQLSRLDAKKREQFLDNWPPINRKHRTNADLTISQSFNQWRNFSFCALMKAMYRSRNRVRSQWSLMAILSTSRRHKALYLIQNYCLRYAPCKLYFYYRSWCELSLFFDTSKILDPPHKARYFSSTPYRHKKDHLCLTHWSIYIPAQSILSPAYFSMLQRVSPFTSYMGLSSLIVSCVDVSRRNVKLYYCTHNLSQYWCVQKRRDVSIHR